MAEKTMGLRESLILAGIDEINTFGANGFSVRRVANACNVSSAAPYKHFKDKQEFIGAIIDYVNDQWAVHQDQILAGCSQDPREQIVTVGLAYIRFLMEKPYYRQILMLKNADFDNLYHRKPGEINSVTEKIMERVKITYQLSDDDWARKSLFFRSMIFGSVFLFDTGEFKYTPQTMEHIHMLLNREFEIP
jgi:AcrR family transcriptional regulator